jgi:putative spermidine/putrescine transport system permease protein
LLTYGGFGSFRRSWLFILVGHVVFTLPFMVRSVMAVFATIDIKTLDEGAASLGASPWQRFLDVIVPNAMPGILAGSLMVVTLSLGEFNLTWMLHTPLTKTLPVGLADSYASMRLEVASAYTLIFFVMIVPLLVAMQIFADERRKR